ncbi:MAG: deoxyribodipyrimidine photo-lyase [Alphaproteobacteria bacterium]|nr:deoxyribodipyrimidine photo-lyase [Alphaproteobacteria bacterium SS10]
MSKPRLHIVWFKRDLRVADNAALTEAAVAAKSTDASVLPLYVVEPELWSQPDYSGRQFAFLSECLSDLRADLAKLGQPLIIRVGDVLSVLNSFAKAHEITGLWSHQETGNGWTFKRDIQVADWCLDHGVEWHQPLQHGVFRTLSNRNGWAKRWEQMMRTPQTQPPLLSPLDGVDLGECPTAKQLELVDDPCPNRQTGGRVEAETTLNSFLFERGEDYQKEMSSPVTAYDACSRLSPHFAFGTLSIREAAQAAWDRQDQLKAMDKGTKGKWPSAMNSFVARLHWHCHFMQKLESEPRLEFQNLHPAYDGLREGSFSQGFFEAYQRGETGFPFVDACLRALAAHGWINFRMRAMLMAFSSYHLWLHWREPSLFLARQFTDFEPGIHYAQSQMQSGTTGINTPRIYNPVKQGHDQDPDGAFVRRWVPELAGLTGRDIHEPWRADPMTLHGAGVDLGQSYPDQLVDHEQAAREARQAIWGVRKGRSYRDTADGIQDQHGSRKSGIKHRGAETSRRRARKDDAQAELL